MARSCTYCVQIIPIQSTNFYQNVELGPTLYSPLPPQSQGKMVRREQSSARYGSFRPQLLLYAAIG